MNDEDSVFNSDEENEDWKPIHTFHKILTKKAQTVYQILTELKAVYGENIADYSGQQLQFMYDDSTVICTKLAGSNHIEDFVVLMENASVIRYHARQLLTSTYGLEFDLDEKPTIEDDYINVLRKEIDAFKEDFKQWISHFPKKESDDEWGLY